MIYEWAQRWGINPAAIEELRAQAGADCDEPRLKTGAVEASVQSRVRLAESYAGNKMWRNNVGAVHTTDGQYIRYGLANDSKALNKRIKSSDLIGIQPVLITQAHVGLKIGQFKSREVKRENWVYRGTSEEKAQLKFIELVLLHGGDAAFTNGREYSK